MISQTVFNQRKQPAAGKLSLVALMDIFTILVFFLLMNSGESQKIENAKFVELPDAASDKAPYADIVIIIGEQELFVDKEPIASIADILKKPQELIEPLQKVLKEYADQAGELKGFEKENGLALTLMGYHAASYELVRSVISTCQHENFRNISLAVNQSSAMVTSLPADLSLPGVGG